MGTSIKVGDTVQVMSGKRNRNPEKPPTRGNGSMRRNTSPNWPAPPVCFLWR